MRLGGNAKFFVRASTVSELVEATKWAKDNSVNFIVIGSGSNIVWQDKGFDGLVVENNILGKRIDGNKLIVSAGENWDEVVHYSVENGLSGLEFLSLIPGSTGATPVQNVGAYGTDISQTLIELSAIDTQTNQVVTLSCTDCGFGYRTSIFNTTSKGRYVILELSFGLNRTSPKPPFYPALADYLDASSITSPTASNIRNAVIAIRSSKLPDPSVVANNGSFFANPIVDLAVAEKLKKDYPTMPFWPYKEDKAKLSAAWLIDQSDLKDFHDKKTGMATWSKQPLVLVNENAQTTQDLIDFRDFIVKTVDSRFGVKLEQEPELI